MGLVGFAYIICALKLFPTNDRKIAQIMPIMEIHVLIMVIQASFDGNLFTGVCSHVDKKSSVLHKTCGMLPVILHY